MSYDVERLENRLRPLGERRLQIESELQEINDQLDYAKRNVMVNGQYADPDWYTRAQYARKMKGREHQKLLRECADLKRDLSRAKHEAYRESKPERTAKPGSLPVAFMSIAEAALSPEQFQSIKALAMQSVSEQVAEEA